MIVVPIYLHCGDRRWTLDRWCYGRIPVTTEFRYYVLPTRLSARLHTPSHSPTPPHHTDFTDYYLRYNFAVVDYLEDFALFVLRPFRSRCSRTSSTVLPSFPTLHTFTRAACEGPCRSPRCCGKIYVVEFTFPTYGPHVTFTLRSADFTHTLPWVVCYLVCLISFVVPSFTCTTSFVTLPYGAPFTGDCSPGRSRSHIRSLTLFCRYRTTPILW